MVIEAAQKYHFSVTFNDAPPVFKRKSLLSDRDRQPLDAGASTNEDSESKLPSDDSSFVLVSELCAPIDLDGVQLI